MTSSEAKTVNAHHHRNGRKKFENPVEQFRFVDDARLDDRQLLPHRLQKEGQDGGLAFDARVVAGRQNRSDAQGRLLGLQRDQHEVGQGIEPAPVWKEELVTNGPKKIILRGNQKIDTNEKTEKS